MNARSTVEQRRFLFFIGVAVIVNGFVIGWDRLMGFLMTFLRHNNHNGPSHFYYSTDKGETWTDEITLRSGDGANRDVGYPRLIQRPDGRLVMVYYWNHVLQKVAKPYRYIAATIFDPDDWK